MSMRALLCLILWLLLRSSLASAQALPSAGASAAAPAATVPTGGAVVTIPAGTFALARKDGKGWSVRVPVAIAEGKTGVATTLLEVVVREARPIAVAETFQVRVVPADNGRGPALVVDTGDKDLLPGSYVLSLKFSDATGKPPFQMTSLTVSVGPPVLKVETTKVVVAQIREIFGGVSAGDGTLKVSWGSGPEPADLTPGEVHDSPAKPEGDRAGLAFVAEPNASASAPMRAFRVSPVGDFPLGTTIGRVDLYSPALASPVSVPYVAYARRSLWWISILAALGAFAGWVLRTQIPGQRNQLLASAAIARVRLHILQALQSVGDADFRDAMRGVSRDIDRADDEHDAAQRMAAAKAADEAVQAALRGIESQVAPLRQRIESLHDIVNPGRPLPPSLSARANQLVPDLERAAQSLNARDICGSAHLVQQLETLGAVALREAADAYLAALVVLLDRAGPQPFPMGSNLAGHLAKIKAAAMVPEPSSTTPQALDRVRDVFELVQQFEDAARIKSEAWCDQVGERLVKAFGAMPADFPQVRIESASAADQFAAALLDPVGSDWPAAADSSLVRAWKEMLTKQAPLSDAAALEQKLQQGHWYEAVEMALNAVAKAAPLALEGLMAPRPVTGEAPVDEAMIVATRRSRAATPGPLAALTEAPTQGDFKVQRQALLEKEQNLALIQSVGFALVFIAGVHLLYSGDWIGTTKEMAALFILAFGVDLTSDSVMAALKR